MKKPTKSRETPVSGKKTKRVTRARTRHKKFVYFFGDGKAEGDREMRDLLGGKGANLAEMTNAGFPVPWGFTISTEACSSYYDQRRKIPRLIEDEIETNLQRLEKLTGAKLGSRNHPLLVSVRSGSKFSMPGMMDTILNLGLNDKAVEGLKARTANGRFAFDSYRRFIQMFGNVVLDVPKDLFEDEFSRIKLSHGATLDTELDENGLRETVACFKGVVKGSTGRAFPEDPRRQLRMARDAVFQSWQNPRAIEYRRI